MITSNFIKKNKLKPPFFLYDALIIEKQFLKLKYHLPKNFRIFYSVKANSNTHLLKIFRKLGAGAEVSSGGELSSVLKAGFNPSKIIFTGPGKTDEELEYAIKNKIYLIIGESDNEIRRADLIASRLKRKQDLLLRINPRLCINYFLSRVPMTGGAQKFGIDEEKIPLILKKLRDYKNINVLGLHLFAASNIFNEILIVKYNDYLFKLVKFIESKFHLQLPVIDIGGGLPVDYSTERRKFNLKRFTSRLKVLIDKYGFSNKNFLIESGRFLVGEGGEYIVKIIDIKTSRREKFAIIDGGVNHISRITLDKKNHIINVVSSRRNRNLDKKESINVVGNLNTATDFISKTRLPKIKIGDLLSIKKVGAYGFCSGMHLLCGHSLPNEYLLMKNDKLKLIRKRLSY